MPNQNRRTTQPFDVDARLEVRARSPREARQKSDALLARLKGARGLVSAQALDAHDPFEPGLRAPILLTGNSRSDLLLALDQVRAGIEAGYYGGGDNNDTGSYSFNVYGMEAPEEDDLEEDADADHDEEAVAEAPSPE